jgi:predicted TIM-barrel fold metal-dependent hydrolase
VTTTIPVIDAFVHVHDRPIHGGTVPPHPVEDQLSAMDELGVDAALIVAGETRTLSDSYEVACQGRFPGRLAVVMAVDPGREDVEDFVAECGAHPGVVGLRMPIRDPDLPGMDTIPPAAAGAGLPVCLSGVNGPVALTFRAADLFGRLAGDYPETQFVLHHLGLRQPYDQPRFTDPFRELGSILDLARWPNIAVAVTASAMLSTGRYPFADLWQPLQRIFDTFGIDRCLWGSNQSRASFHVTYREAIAAVRDEQPLTSAERTALLSRTAERIFHWTPGVLWHRGLPASSRDCPAGRDSPRLCLAAVRAAHPRP